MAWSMPRPENHISDVIDIVEWINSSYEDSNCGLLSDFSVLVAGYYEKDPGYPAYWDDYVKLRLDTETSISAGHIHSINISSSHADGTGRFKFHLYAQVQTGNLQISVYNSSSDEQHSAFIHSSTENKPQSCFLSHIVAYWIFTDPNIRSHQLEIAMKTTIWNGTIYKEIMQPILLEMKVP